MFNFDVSYMFRTPRIHLQGDGCVCSYGMVQFTCIGISSLVSRRVCPTAYTDACKTHYTVTVHTTVFLKMNPGGSKHVEDIKIKN